MDSLGYARISKSEKNSVSIEFQIVEIRKLARSQGYHLIDIHIDDGISGKSIKNRPGVQRVLDAVANQSVDAVIVYRSDRMSRDGLEGLQIEKLFADRGVKYLSCTEGLLAGGSLDDVFMGFIRNGLNQRERHLVSQRTRQALQLKKSKGERLGSQPRYGYKVINRNMVSDFLEQELIKKISEFRETGMSIREITNIINHAGFRTRKSTLSAPTQIRRILTALTGSV